MIQILMEGEGDEIKSKQASKIDRTSIFCHCLGLLKFLEKCNIFHEKQFFVKQPFIEVARKLFYQPRSEF